MEMKLFFNQYTNGGTVIKEAWETFNAEEETMTYGSCYSLKAVTLILPEKYGTGKNFLGKTVITNEDGDQVEIKGEYDQSTIKLLDPNHKHPIKGKVKESNAEDFQELRKRTEMKQKEFAEKYGIPYRTYQRWEEEGAEQYKYTLLRAAVEYKN